MSAPVLDNSQQARLVVPQATDLREQQALSQGSEVVTAVTPLRNPLAQPASDAEIGLAWFNAMTELERLEALRAANTCCPAEAWAHRRATAGKCEEVSHG